MERAAEAISFIQKRMEDYTLEYCDRGIGEVMSTGVLHALKVHTAGHNGNKFELHTQNDIVCVSCVHSVCLSDCPIEGSSGEGLFSINSEKGTIIVNCQLIVTNGAEQGQGEINHNFNEDIRDCNDTCP